MTVPFGRSFLTYKQKIQSLQIISSKSIKVIFEVMLPDCEVVVVAGAKRRVENCCRKRE
jgi:hypothetical protein